MSPERWGGVRRVLAAHPGGEEVASLARALRLLREALPAATLTLLADPARRGDAAGLDVDAFLPWHSPRDAAAARTVVEAIRAGEFDAALIFTAPGGSPHALGYLCFLAGVPLRAGLSREFAGAVLTACPAPPPDGTGAEERHVHLLRALGFGEA